MSKSTVIGNVHVVEETKTYGANGFRKRVVVLEQDNDRFTSYIPIEFLKDDCDKLDGLSVGDYVEIEYRLGGRRWQRDAESEVKYFLSAEGLGYNVMKKSSVGEQSLFSEAVKEEDYNNSVPDSEVPF